METNLRCFRRFAIIVLERLAFPGVTGGGPGGTENQVLQITKPENRRNPLNRA